MIQQRRVQIIPEESRKKRHRKRRKVVGKKRSSVRHRDSTTSKDKKHDREGTERKEQTIENALRAPTRLRKAA